MHDSSEANLCEAVEFEGELRAWLKNAHLDAALIEDCLLSVYARWLQTTPLLLGPEQIRRQSFAYARECALIQCRDRSDVERGALAQRLTQVPRALPPPVPFTLKRQLKVVRAAQGGRCYEVFELYAVNGLQTQQIATHLGVSEEEVIQALARAARALAAGYCAQPSHALTDAVSELSQVEPMTTSWAPRAELKDRQGFATPRYASAFMRTHQ
jgi:DNA-directed RNA polymerase specialized sigma24 family protein